MKHIFVVNPAAGKLDASTSMQETLSVLDGRVDYEIYYTQAPGDATAYIRDYCRTHGEAVRFYACGGDGTLNEVVNGAIGFAHASVGCFPCGSGNDYVKYYGGKKFFLDLEAQLEAREVEIDLMRVGNKYAINATHFGFDSCVAKTMLNVRRKKLVGGKNAYTTGIVVALFRAMKNKCRVYADGELLNPEETILLCTVANGQYVGGSFRCAPRSRNDDGLLEVCVIKPVSHVRFMKLISSYTEGTHLDNPKVEPYLEYRRARSVRVEAPEGFVYSFDGELIRQNSFTVEIAPRALRFAVPKGARPLPSGYIDSILSPDREEESTTV